ncbi:28S ribosomal protein S29 [Blattella germanica]|nr:28S ribosomal protein S29 [Blattella germanica]
MAHALHFGYVSECLLVHVPEVHMWMRNCKEVSNSATREGHVDLNLDAAAWLVHFKIQNAVLLNKLDLRMTRKYMWSKREETEEGAPLLDLVDFGIKRVKYASDCVIALVQEIKRHSTEGRCKTLVAIDGFNAFFYPTTRVKTEAKVCVPPWKITLTEAFLEITKYDWCNAAVIVTVDKTSVPKHSQESSLPLYLLGKEGFEHLDPFVPIKMSEYDDNEVESCLEYYIDRRWLQNKKGCTEEGKTELKYLSGMNPRRLMEICAPL